MKENGMSNFDWRDWEDMEDEAYEEERSRKRNGKPKKSWNEQSKQISKKRYEKRITNKRKQTEKRVVTKEDDE